MKNRRTTLAGLVVVAGLAFATAGCGLLGTTSAEPSPSPKTSKEALLASVTELQKTPFTFTLKDAQSAGNGAVDPGAKNAILKITFSDATIDLTLNIEFLVVADDAWAKIDFGRAAGLPGLPELPNKWMHLDRSKLENPDDIGLDDADPAGAADIFSAIVTAEQSGDRQYKGTLDLTNAKAKDAGLIDEDIVTDLGDLAKSVPFEATTDESGRLTDLKIIVPTNEKVEAQTWEATYADYGEPVTVTKPEAADSVEAPDAAYDLFNS